MTIWRRAKGQGRDGCRSQEITLQGHEESLEGIKAGTKKTVELPLLAS